MPYNQKAMLYGKRKRLSKEGKDTTDLELVDEETTPNWNMLGVPDTVLYVALNCMRTILDAPYPHAQTQRQLEFEDARTAICLCLERVSALPPPPDVLNSAMFPFFRRACDAYPVLFASEDSLSTLMRVLRRNAALLALEDVEIPVPLATITFLSEIVSVVRRYAMLKEAVRRLQHYDVDAIPTPAQLVKEGFTHVLDITVLSISDEVSDPAEPDELPDVDHLAAYRWYARRRRIDCL